MQQLRLFVEDIGVSLLFICCFLECKVRRPFVSVTTRVEPHTVNC